MQIITVTLSDSTTRSYPLLPGHPADKVKNTIKKIESCMGLQVIKIKEVI